MGCRFLGARGLLVSPFRDQIPHGLPSSVQWVDSVPFGRLFPRSAAVVHHGGIGTSAQAPGPELLSSSCRWHLTSMIMRTGSSA